MDAVPWFKEATLAVKAFQDRMTQNDRSTEEARRAPFIEQLKVEIAALKSKSEESDNTKLLQHVYEMHPPRELGSTRVEKTTNSVGAETAVSMKDQYKKSLIHYHPDRVGKKHKDDMKWVVLCEEIYKYLAAKYEGYK
jgi:hypothetical protein